MIKFQLYKPEKNKLLTIQIVILGIAFVIIYFLFPSMDLSVIAAAFFIFIAYLAFTEKKQLPTGNVLMDSHHIEIKTLKNEIQIELSKINKLDLIYSGFHGKKVTGDIIPKYNRFSGLDNYLKIEKDDQIFEYKFQVEDESQENELIDLIMTWENLGYDISNIKINK